MQDLWVSIWAVIWFGSLGVFGVLSVLVIIFGGRDLAAMLIALRSRHEGVTEDEPMPT